MIHKTSEADFQRRAEATILELEQAFSNLADDRDIDVEVEGGVLKITFEEGEPGIFIVSANSSVRQLWVSARVSSYKFDWSEEAGDFVLAATGESLRQVMTRLTQQQLGDNNISL
jgi:CyaY protein